MPFPASRFRRAGATPDQVAQLEAEYDALDPIGQAALEARLVPISDYDIAEQFLAEPEAVEEPEPEPDPDPVPQDGPRYEKDPLPPVGEPDEDK
jgi:hypothetical protein